MGTVRQWQPDDRPTSSADHEHPEVVHNNNDNNNHYFIHQYSSVVILEVACVRVPEDFALPVPAAFYGQSAEPCLMLTAKSRNLGGRSRASMQVGGSPAHHLPVTGSRRAVSRLELPIGRFRTVDETRDTVRAYMITSVDDDDRK